MMRLLLLFCIMLPGFALCQKIGIKKDKVLYNEEEVAVIKSSYRDHYEFYTLNNQKVFDLDLKGIALAGKEFLYYLDMKAADGRTTQIPYEILITSFKPDRIIAHQLAVKYNFFTKQGLNTEEINAFFDVQRENLTDKYLQAKAGSIAAESDRQSGLNNIRTLYNPRIGPKGEILVNDGVYPAKIIGYSSVFNCGFNSSSPCLEVRDLDGIRVATLYQSNRGIKNYIVTTFDNNEFTYPAIRTYAPSDYAFMNEFVTYLLAEGYTLGHQAYYKNQELQQAKVKDAVDRSINLYDVPGYVVDRSGKRTEGLVTIWFEQLDTERTGQKLSAEGADLFGQRVTLKTGLPRGTGIKTYDADSGIHFCVPYNGGEDCYYGLDVKGELMKKLQNYGALHGNNYYFYRLVAKENKIMLLQDPVELQKYVIKTDIQPKGQMIDNRSSEKLSLKLADYLKDCKAVSESLKKDNLDLKNEENLINIISEYSKCRK
ncbi:hypothetical protein [Chryseobacterium gregarium]|uniref:hypothetical protein n=1 Tax=Chryseobacterium gregarium TaxID=456299 RepID=UPI0012DECBBA|nr:hypothetical protein [Chryseobacterium gregarium]